MGDGLDLLGPESSPAYPAEEVCADGEVLFGIDISHWQGAVDWNAAANDGVSFAIVRVSDGLGTVDDWFDVNLPASRAAGLPTGVYQFFRPSQDPIAQADLLIAGIQDHGGLLPGDLPPVIDVEDTGGLGPAAVAAAVGQWIDHVEAEFGVTPIIYSGKYFWQDNVQSSAYASYPLWAPHYTSNACPNIANQWTDWVIWQYSDAGSVAGVSGGVDSNWFNGGIDELNALLVGGGGECGDGTCDPGETPTSCPADCPPCGVIPPEGKIIDETDACFLAGGNPDFWRDEATGYEDTHLWTVATDSDSPANYGVWDLFFEQAGAYELSVYIQTGSASSQQAPYQIRHDGLDSVHSIDQSAVDGWISLGEFAFEAGGEQWLRLDDNTGESWELDRVLVYDAIRLTPMGGGTEGGSESGSTTTESTTIDTEGTTTEDTASAGAETTDAGGVSTDGGSDGDGDDGGGCACRTRTQTNPLSGLALLGLLGLGRRRKRTRPA